MNRTTFLQIMKHLGVLVFFFLTELAYNLLLFAFPLLLLFRYHSVLLLAGMIIFIPLASLIVNFLADSLGTKKNVKLYMIAGYTLLFIMTFLSNQPLAGDLLPVLLVLWGAGMACLRLGIQLAPGTQRQLANWSFLFKPVQAVALVLAPVFCVYTLLNNDSATLFSFFGINLALSALLFPLLFQQNASAQLQAQAGRHISWNWKEGWNLSVIFGAFLDSLFWLVAPAAMYLRNADTSQIVAITLCFSGPYFLLVIIKNVFRVRVWQLRPVIKYAIAVTLLASFLLIPPGAAIFVMALLLGVFLGLMQISDHQEQKQLRQYFDYQGNFALGMLLGIIWGMLSLNYSTFETGLGISGIVILVLILIRLSRAGKLRVSITLE